MLRQFITKRVSAVRTFSVARPAAYSTGKDSFKEREAANENAYVKKHEAEQLKELKKKLEEQKKTVLDLEIKINDLKN